jgi:hypothetical protein
MYAECQPAPDKWRATVWLIIRKQKGIMAICQLNMISLLPLPTHKLNSDEENNVPCFQQKADLHLFPYENTEYIW